MIFYNKGFQNRINSERIRVNPELDDILDWLGIYPFDPEYEMKNRVAESLFQHLEILRVKVNNIRKIIKNVRKLIKESVPQNKIVKYVESRLEDIYIDKIPFAIEELQKFSKDKSFSENKFSVDLGLSSNILTFKSNDNCSVDLELIRLLSSKIGIELLEYTELENICLYGRYSFNETESLVSNMICLESSLQ